MMLAIALVIDLTGLSPDSHRAAALCLLQLQLLVYMYWSVFLQCNIE
jgi:hypothetical protein